MNVFFFLKTIFIMKQIDDLDAYNPLPRAVITIGNFDGVHIGHQALFHHTVEKAKHGTPAAKTLNPTRQGPGSSGSPRSSHFMNKGSWDFKTASMFHLRTLPKV
jgi:riboflavin kinase/FMN adenylyltransferase